MNPINLYFRISQNRKNITTNYIETKDLTGIIGYNHSVLSDNEEVDNIDDDDNEDEISPPKKKMCTENL